MTSVTEGFCGYARNTKSLCISVFGRTCIAVPESWAITLPITGLRGFGIYGVSGTSNVTHGVHLNYFRCRVVVAGVSTLKKDPTSAQYPLDPYWSNRPETRSVIPKIQKKKARIYKMNTENPYKMEKRRERDMQQQAGKRTGIIAENRSLLLRIER